jgi:hypothetical protein
MFKKNQDCRKFLSYIIKPATWMTNNNVVWILKKKYSRGQNNSVKSKSKPINQTETKTKHIMKTNSK